MLTNVSGWAAVKCASYPARPYDFFRVGLRDAAGLRVGFLRETPRLVSRICQNDRPRLSTTSRLLSKSGILR